MDRSSFSKTILLCCAIMVFLLISTANPSCAGQIATYWGVGTRGLEGSLAILCNSGDYEIIVIHRVQVSISGTDRQPTASPYMPSHCDGASGGCRGYRLEIETCQSLGIKVLIDIGIDPDPYPNLGSLFLSSDQAKQMAEYIWDNYMGGSNDNSPLGAAKIDGVEVHESISYYGADFARRLREIAESQGYKKVYFTATVYCLFPEPRIGPSGNSSSGKFLDAQLVDFVSVAFFSYTSCDIRGGVDAVVNSWKEWTTGLPDPKPKVFAKLFTSKSTSEYIDRDTLIHNVLPRIKLIGNYGGVMLWDTFVDRSYASYMKSSV